VSYRPASKEYSLELEVGPAGREEVMAILGPDHKPVEGRRIIGDDEYAFIVASLALRFSQVRRERAV